MRSPTRWSVLCLLALLVAGSGAEAQSRPKIKILLPRLGPGVRPEQANASYDQLVTGLQQIFPCAELQREDHAQALIREHRARALRLGNGEDPTEELGEIVRTDYAISATFMVTGDPVPTGRSLKAFMWSPSPGGSSANEIVFGQGGDWGSPDLARALSASAEYREISFVVCPWVGTIVYERSVDSTARATVRSVEGTGIGGVVVKDGDPTSTTVHTDTYKSHEEEKWTFTLVRRQRGRGYKITTEGSAAMTSDAEQLAVATNKTCFPQAADGSVSDSRVVRGASDEIRDHQGVTARAEGPLLAPQVRVERGDSGGTWTLIVGSRSSGSGAGEGTNSRKGGCGSWSHPDPANTGPIPYGRLLSFTVDGVPERQTELGGTFPDVDGIGGDVTVALTRK